MNYSYFDIAGIVLPYQLALLMQIADSDKILYGADYPYTPLPAVHQLANQFEEFGQIASVINKTIWYNNR